MTHGNSLAMTVEATHDSLVDRIAAARTPNPARPRDSTDAFLAAASRHLAAVEAVLVPRVQGQVPDGVLLSVEYLAAARALEQTLTLVKARLYGETHAAQLSWSALWGEVQQELEEHNKLELRLVDAVIRHDDADVDGLAKRVFDTSPSADGTGGPEESPEAPLAAEEWVVKILALAVIAPVLVASSAIADVPVSQATVEPAHTTVLLGPSAPAVKGTLRGSVGPGFTITLKKAGKRVARLMTGTYVVKVADRSDEHNFHLRGPGVDRSTSVPGKGPVTWRVRLRKGTYTYVCDPHAAILHGSFKVS